MAFSHTLAGTTFTEANFQGTAYANEQSGFPKAMEKIVEHVANAYFSRAQSLSLAVGIGSKSMTLDPSKPFAVGQPVRIAKTLDPLNVFMDGTVTAYNPANGAITVEVVAAKGSGTHSDWTVSIGGVSQTTVATSPLPVAEGGTGATAASAARSNLGLGTVSVLNRVNIANGGTNATTAAGARSNLGLGSVATDNTVPVARGGTGATSTSAARTNLGLGSVATTNRVAVSQGGTNAATAAGARNNLGLGTMATVNAPVPVAQGGTGATTPAQAVANLGLSAGPKVAKYSIALVQTSDNFLITAAQGVGSGWLNAIHIRYNSPETSVQSIEFTIDGGAPYTTSYNGSYYPEMLEVAGTSQEYRYSGWIPLNIRFNTSVIVKGLKHNISSRRTYIYLSWALDS